VKWLSYICICLVLAPYANAQTQARNDWTMLQRLNKDDKVAIQLKTGEKLKGDFSAATDMDLTISVHSSKRKLNRNDVKKVQRVTGDSVGITTLKGTAVGAATGATVGAAAGEDCPKPNSGLCLSRPLLATVGAIVFAIPGAAVGLVIGLHRHHRELIYEAV
jgi:hypothetical protein